MSKILYLNEEKLGIELKKIFPNEIFKHNVKLKSFIDNDFNFNFKNFSVDYYCENLKLAVEFNGYLHYTKSKQIYNDIIKSAVLNMNHITLVEIPYFVQLSTDTIKYYFDKDIEYEQVYSHGFIDKNAVLPADFCSIGISRFNFDLSNIDKKIGNVKQDIYNSIIDQFKLKDYICVLPNNLWDKECRFFQNSIIYEMKKVDFLK